MVERNRAANGQLLPGRVTDTMMLNARVSAAKVETLTAAAERRGLSRSEAVREALDRWIDAEGAA